MANLCNAFSFFTQRTPVQENFDQYLCIKTADIPSGLKYEDVIEADEVDFTNQTHIYLVKCGDKYGVKALSTEPTRLTNY